MTLGAGVAAYAYVRFTAVSYSYVCRFFPATPKRREFSTGAHFSAVVVRAHTRAGKRNGIRIYDVNSDACEICKVSGNYEGKAHVACTLKWPKGEVNPPVIFHFFHFLWASATRRLSRSADAATYVPLLLVTYFAFNPTWRAP